MIAVHLRLLPARAWLSGCAAILASLASCSPGGGAAPIADTPSTRDLPVESAGPGTASAVAPACPPRETPGPLPNIAPEQLTLDYWLGQLGKQHDLDEVLLSPEQVEHLNLALQVPRADYHPQRDLLAPLDAALLAGEVNERRSWARDKIGAGEYVTASGERLPAAVLEPLAYEAALEGVQPELRVALRDEQIHCAPLPESFYSTSLDLRLDRNACSRVRAQEPVRVIARWPSGMLLVQSRSAFGWLAADARLSLPLSAALARAFVHGTKVRVKEPGLLLGPPGAATSVAPGTLLPAEGKPLRAQVAGASGFSTSSREQAALLEPTRRPLTRRLVLEELWRYLGGPYGLGDTNGGRDCSRLLQDVFASFGLELPRHSSWQAQAGSFWIDVEGVPERERTFLFDAAAQRGIVLLHFPGHIMLYLGRSPEGQPLVFHALGEYAEACPGGSQGAEGLVRVQKIGVSDLELGRGTSRRSLLERITRITVLGGTPGVELAGVARVRPAAPARIPADRACRDSEQAAIYTLPEQPNTEQPLRVLSAVNFDPGAATLTLIDPDGQRVQPEVLRLGGPPYGQVVTIDKPRRGRWKAVLADGNDVKACQRIAVTGRRPKPAEPEPGPIWTPKYKWNQANENLYALFVERLFDYPLEDDRTWTSLHPLLRDPERNLLFDYRGLEEESALTIAPDCADLPYVLRAYFAWKLRLPFGFKRCSRGRVGKPPTCDYPGAGDNLMSRLELAGKGGVLQPRADVEAFSLFVNTVLRSAVHSSSGRTLPEDELADLYPVPLTREALRPGTVFADPYGHMLVIASWVPQPLTGTGILIGADAQPDGTIGQRRFWRGTFLFDPDTSAGGAGFKAFRPRQVLEQPLAVELKPKEGEPATVERVGLLEDVENAELKRSRRYVPLSLQQYEGSADDFYEQMEALINPRPLEPRTVLLSLLDAFAESVARRVKSIDNAEKWWAEHPDDVVVMPEGDGIFLSSGPWEDFSTPSRDLRLLISIDTVTGFDERVRAAPQRFGIAAAELEPRLKELRALRDAELGKRTISYTRSDGSTQILSLAQVVQRAPQLELAYNPNDCPELRWGAAAGSAEAATCKRHAPPEQAAKMQSYRHWFATRKRPPT